MVVVNQDHEAKESESGEMNALRQTFGPQETPRSRWGAESREAQYISPSPAGKIVPNPRYEARNDALQRKIAKIKKA